MTQRSFRGQAGRPFGTVAALLCLLLTLALIVLGRVAAGLTGVASAAEVDPARLQAMHDVWGLFLAGEIVRIVTGGALLLAVLTLAGPIGPRTPGRGMALAVGTLAAIVMIIAGRQGIITAAHLSEPIIVPYTDVYAALGRTAVVLVGLWAALTALEARRAASLPRWLQALGLALCVIALASALYRPLLYPTAMASLVWWGAIFATLYRPEDRVPR